MKEDPEGAQQRDILRPVEPAPARPLHGTDNGEARLPEAQDVRRHSDFLSGFGNRPKGFGTLGHGLL